MVSVAAVGSSETTCTYLPNLHNIVSQKTAALIIEIPLQMVWGDNI
jgi:hypothetical protein